MSEEQFLCEYCGYYSNDQKRCSRCGRDIESLFTQPASFKIPLQGKLIIRLFSPRDAEDVWKELAEFWGRLERDTSLGLSPGQMDKFPLAGNTLELYGSELEIEPVTGVLRERGTVEFQELPREEIPQRPTYQLPRPPRVPRNRS